jgi:hypothetical protein
MAFITEFRAREKLERGIHWVADHGLLPGCHRPHFGHVAAELVQTGIVLAVFLTQLVYVLSNNDFRTGWVLLSSATKSLILRFSAAKDAESR